MSHSIRKNYRGVDPVVEDLVSTINQLREELAYTKHKLKEIDPNTPKTRQLNGELKKPLDKWLGSDFLQLFDYLYLLRYKTEYPREFVSEAYPKSRISQFISRSDVRKDTYLGYVLFLFYDDPWTQAGDPPEVGRLWNRKMYSMFMSKIRSGKVNLRSLRNIPQGERSSGDSLSSLSPEMRAFVEREGSSL